ncbi:hypothetical protein [Microbacterium sp.]|uniref:hypothetical protein n=1 Tax=Microbacterium sp. TaxID=51671 RepID=UPI0039E56B4E
MDALASALAPLVVPLVGLVGVGAGAALSALLARRNDVHRSVRELRRQVYFEALDMAFALYEHMQTFARNAPKGGESKKADKAAAKALQAGIKVYEKFPRVEA